MYPMAEYSHAGPEGISISIVAFLLSLSSFMKSQGKLGRCVLVIPTMVFMGVMTLKSIGDYLHYLDYIDKRNSEFHERNVLLFKRGL